MDNYFKGSVTLELRKEIEKLEEKVTLLDDEDIKNEFFNIKNKINSIVYTKIESWDELLWSNCLIESIKAWGKSPYHIKIFKYGAWLKSLKKGTFPHFYWYDSRDRYFYDFRRGFRDYGFWIPLWYKGRLHRWKGIGFHK